MEKQMYASLALIKQKYDALNKKLNSNEVTSNIKEYTKIIKEVNTIKDIALVFSTYISLEANLKDSKEIIRIESDLEMINMAKEEILNIEPKLRELENKLKVLLLPKNINDNKNVIVEIRGAAGGDEANIFAGNLLDIYQKWASLNSMKITILNKNKGIAGGYSFVEFKVEGEKAYSKLKFESGVHRVQRVPSTETQGRVQTSTATVIVMPEADESVPIELISSELKIDTYRSSGAGGQSVNTTDSAVRITHIPTGITASSQDGKSQISNKELAIKTLKTRLYDLQLKKEQAEKGEFRKLGGTGMRSEKVRTYNWAQDRVTDHRIGFSTSLKSVLDGKINSIINALLAEEQAEKIKNARI